MRSWRCWISCQALDHLKKKKIKKELIEELGDLWLQILLHCEIAGEVKAFDLYDVASQLNDKLIRRHPHVFGEKSLDSADSVVTEWEKIKASEKKESSDPSVLSGVPKHLPALQKAERMIEKVSRVGFQWNDVKGALDKIKEEIAELESELQEKVSLEKTEEEFGDLLFTLCNFAYFLKLKPENALRRTLQKFERRFRYVETQAHEQNRSLDELSLKEMDALWDQAKQLEKD